MTRQANFTIKGRNPDVLTCIANLSNDEVFTPPEFANQMLDTLAESWAKSNNGENIWANPDLKFLDPFTKSGVFLREIVSRLTAGLEDKIPDLQKRVDHIVTKQVFGIGVTELTSLLARRSVYCSKYANGEHSIGKSFDSEQGNIWFERTEHTWVGGSKGLLLGEDENGEPVYQKIGAKCKYCGASNSNLDRGNESETYAYAFIHTDNIKTRIAELFGEEMHFDVIVGNPPYQLQSDGGTRDVPIYQKFVEQAKKLEPRFLTMVIPSRWMASGLGLSAFREVMLTDKRIQKLVDYPVSSEVFPGVEVKAGVCFFLWDSRHNGDCITTSVRGGIRSASTQRSLDEFDVLVRDSTAIPILRKVLAHGEPSIKTILAVDKEFGWTSNFDEFNSEKSDSADIPIHFIRKSVRGVGYISRSKVTKSKQLIDTYKLLVPQAGSDGGQKIPDSVLGKSLIANSPSVCTQSYLFFHSSTLESVKSIQSYYQTKFFRFLVSLRKITQHATNSTYSWVPIQTWDRKWTDQELFAKYDLTTDEISYIEEIIRPMGTDGDD